MKQWMNRYPQIHMCILALKYILAQRGFSSNFKGGIGSYCLFVMVAAYIREYPEL
jgi:DNA polymerase sigma